MDFNLDWNTAQAFGVLALIFNFIAYRQHSANSYRIISALALASLSTHFLLLGAMAGAFVTALAVVRNLVALRWQGKVILWFFVGLNVVLAAYEIWLGTPWLQLIAAYGSSLIFTVGSIRLNDPHRIRRWFIVAESLGLAYAVMVGSVEGIIFNVVNLSSIILKLLQDRIRR